MTALETAQFRDGEHWLADMAKELGVFLDYDEIEDLEPGEIALLILDRHGKENDIEPRAKLHITCYPWEKRLFTKFAQGRGGLTNWIRKTCLEEAMREPK